jgi:hypothetical protein
MDGGHAKSRCQMCFPGSPCPTDQVRVVGSFHERRCCQLCYDTFQKRFRPVDAENRDGSESGAAFELIAQALELSVGRFLLRSVVSATFPVDGSGVLPRDGLPCGTGRRAVAISICTQTRRWTHSSVRRSKARRNRLQRWLFLRKSTMRAVRSVWSWMTALRQLAKRRQPNVQFRE